MRNVALVVAGSGAAQVISILSAPVLSRVYSPSDFGLFASFTAISSVILSISSLRYELAIPLPKSDGEALALVRLSLVLNVGTSVVVGAALPLADAVERALGAPGLSSLLLFLPLFILVTGTYQALSYWAVRGEDYRSLSRVALDQALAQAGVSVAAGAAGMAPEGLVLGGAVGRSAGTMRMLRLVRSSTPRWWRASATRVRQVARDHWRFPMMSSWVALLIALSLQLPPLLVVALYDVRLAGLLSLAARVVGTPMTLLGNAVSQVFLGESARLARDDPRMLKRLFVRVSAGALAAGAVPFAVVALVAPDVLGWVLGSEWREAGVVVRVVAPMFLLQLATSPPSHVLTVLGRQARQVLFAAVRLVGIVAAFVGAHSAGWSGMTALALYSAVMSLTYAWFWILCYGAVDALDAGTVATSATRSE